MKHKVIARLLEANLLLAPSDPQHGISEHISRQFLRYVLAFFFDMYLFSHSFDLHSDIDVTYFLTGYLTFHLTHIFWHSIWHIYIIIYIIIYIYCMYVDIWSAIFYAFYLTLCMAFFLAFDLAFYLTSCWSNMINLHTIWRALSHILWHSTWHIFWHSLTTLCIIRSDIWHALFFARLIWPSYLTFLFHMFSDILFHMFSDILCGFHMLHSIQHISSDILSDMFLGKSRIIFGSGRVRLGVWETLKQRVNNTGGHDLDWWPSWRVKVRADGLISQVLIWHNLTPIVSEWQLGKAKNPACRTINSHLSSFHPLPFGAFPSLWNLLSLMWERVFSTKTEQGINRS